jgi:Zn-dependent peptidase ImmA (M78 family)
MSPRSVSADVNPDLLTWARETAGLNLSSVARRLHNIDKWELGTEKPTVRQLEALADLYKRPLAAFFLPTRPEEPSLPTDFRMLPSEEDRVLSKKVRLAMRTARRTQRLYAELLNELGTTERSTLPNITAEEDPEELGTRVRSWLGVTVADQLTWPDMPYAFRAWREAIEARGTLILQLTMPVKESRGFSLADGPIPTAVVSSSDAIAARIFTLFHELGHLLLNEGGICLPDPSTVSSNASVEPFCNRFAGAVLVPSSSLSERVRPSDLLGTPEAIADRLGEPARAFKVSRYVILFRLYALGLVKSSQLQAVLRQLESREVARPRRGGIRPAIKTLGQLGPRFVSAVLAAHRRGVITYSDVSHYLSLNLKYLPDLLRFIAARG